MAKELQRDCLGFISINVRTAFDQVQIATVGDVPLDAAYRGWYATLDKAGIDELIERLVKARDAVYGREDG